MLQSLEKTIHLVADPFLSVKGSNLSLLGVINILVWVCFFCLNVSLRNIIQGLKEWEIYHHGILYNIFLNERTCIEAKER